LASNITLLEEHGRGRGWDDYDLRDIIQGKDARDRVKNWRQEREHMNCINAMRGTMIIMVPTTTNLIGNAPLKVGIIQEESKLCPAT
jgi:hypothetical protein